LQPAADVASIVANVLAKIEPYLAKQVPSIDLPGGGKIVNRTDGVVEIHPPGGPVAPPQGLQIAAGTAPTK
jgi:hypothetical protein